MCLLYSWSASVWILFYLFWASPGRHRSRLARVGIRCSLMFQSGISYKTNPHPQLSELWQNIQLTLDTRDEIPSLTSELQTPSIPSANAPSPASYLKSKKARFEFRSHIQTPSPPPISPTLSRESTIAPSMMSNRIVSRCDAICVGCREWALSHGNGQVIRGLRSRD